MCNGMQSCDPEIGCVVVEPSPECDDEDACTTDSCDPDLGCQFVPIDDCP